MQASRLPNPGQSHNKATLPAIKQHNSRLILRLLREQGSLSRADLARRTNLSRPAISAIVRGLMEAGLLAEVGVGRSLGGKRPTLLSLLPNARQLIAVDLSGSRFCGVRSNLRAEVLCQQSAPARSQPEEPLARLYELLDTLLASGDDNSLLGIGIATPGLVDSTRGAVLFAANLGWRDVPLAQLLAERYRLPVYVENDTHLASLGEFYFGAGRDKSPLAVAHVGNGIGAGLIIDGQIYSGANGWSGEIGHLRVVEQGQRCTCGRYGCLETMASAWSIVGSASELAALHPASRLGQLAAAGQVDLDAVRQALLQGDPYALQLVERAGYYLGVALAAVVHVFNPRRVVVGGSVARFGDPLLDSIRRGLKSSALPALASATEIAVTSLAERAGLMGAIALVLKRELGLY